MKSKKLISECSEQLQNIMEYINSMQNIKDPNAYLLGFRIGIVLSELGVLQQDINALQEAMKEELN